MDIFSLVIFVIIVVVVKGMKNFNATAPKRGPVIGTPTPRQHPAPSPTNRPVQEWGEDKQQDWQEMLEPAGNGQTPDAKPVLRRNPYAERSDYGASPLNRTQPPSQSPLKSMLDQAFLTGEDLTPQQERDLPLQVSGAQEQADNRELLATSFAQAFPAANKIAKATRPGIHRPIRLKARGRKTIRNAVLMSEVIARPRAFDL